MKRNLMLKLFVGDRLLRLRRIVQLIDTGRMEKGKLEITDFSISFVTEASLLLGHSTKSIMIDPFRELDMNLRNKLLECEKRRMRHIVTYLVIPFVIQEVWLLRLACGVFK